jgi:serine/threonine protein kinase
MTQLACLRCKEPIDSDVDQCPHCGERVTLFQRTYASRLIDGKYQILDRLGVGGMGEIFKVRHIHLNELRVIKIMRPNVAADDQGMQRFLQEARTSTMIKHKNLAMLYDFAQLEDGSYYMVWEFIDGTNIQKWIAQNGPVPARLSIEIAIQALMGLDHLHSMGLIHRDISPENIMLSQDHHGKLLVKVIDFGIAKSLAEGDSGQGLTQTGMFLGKLKYASPEQAGFLKDNEHLDPRSDLYSFGILLYEMLAGRAPFQATNPHGYILKHVTEKPAPIAELNPDVRVPAALEALIMRALEKSRDARFPTAADFAQELEAIRNTVAPEQKYGLGERMVTLSSAQTLADLPKYSGTYGTAAGGTMPGGTKAATPMPGRSGPTGTKVADEEATLMERNLSPQTQAGVTSPQMGRKTIGSDEATVMENLGARMAAPTALEAKWGGQGQAEPTLMERVGMPPEAPKKKNTATIAAMAGGLVLILAIAAVMVMRSRQPQVVTTTAAPATTNVTSSAPTPAPIASGKGALLLSASPWGDLEKIVDDKNNPVDLSDEKRSTPTRIELSPGKYTVVMSGPDGSKTFDVTIADGKPTAKNVEMKPVNMNDLEKEIGQQ